MKQRALIVALAGLTMTASTAAMADVVVKLGFAGPLTGPVSHLGKDEQYGAQLALDDANAPFAQMFMIEGRTEEQKAVVIDLVSQAFVTALGTSLEKTRVWITEVPKTNWGIGGKTAKNIGR